MGSITSPMLSSLSLSPPLSPMMCCLLCHKVIAPYLRTSFPLPKLCFNLKLSQCREFIDPPNQFVRIKESEFRELVLVTYQGFEPHIFICLGFVRLCFKGLLNFA